VCATHRDLVGDVDTGRFRADLYYRLAVSTVVLPPLRDRREDVVPLFTHFLGQALSQAAGQAPGEGRARARRPVAVTPAVADVLLRRDYPGNLRDLRQLAYRVAARHVGPGPVTPGDLPPTDRPVPPRTGFVPLRPASPVPSVPEPDDVATPAQPGLEEAVRAAVGAGASLKGLREQVADLAVDAALDESGGSVRAAAARLGVTERALHLRRAQRRNGSTPDAPETAETSEVLP